MSRLAELRAEAYALPDGDGAMELRARLFSPSLVVYMDKVRANVRRIIGLAGGADRWRPHVKTTKIPAVFAELARAGVRSFKCATVREARVLLRTLAEEGVEEPDLLVAYPLREPALGALADVARRHPRARVSVLCEDPDLIDAIPATLTVFLDLNPGMDRTGIPLSDTDRIRTLVQRAGTRFRGLHYYDGHLHGPLAERRAQIFAGYDALLAEIDAIEHAGTRVAEVITAGTPAFLHALEDPRLDQRARRHRVSPGTVVFHDVRSEHENPGLGLEPAALVFTRVVSRPRADVATCDAGSKSIAAEAPEPCAFVLGHPELVPQVPSEEHLPLRGAPDVLPSLGDELLLVPFHVCPTVNLAEQALLIDGPEATPVTVDARAHDLLASGSPASARSRSS